MKRKLRFLSLLAGLIFSISLLTAVPQTVHARGKSQKDCWWRDGWRYHRYYRYPRHYRCRPRRIRFTDKEIDRLIFIGGIYFLSKAISEARCKREVVYVFPPPRYIYVPSPQPIYTPVAYATTVTVRNSTHWYIVVDINRTKLNLAPGWEQAVSWTYTGRGHYVQAWAYLDPYHQQLAGTYQGNLVGYQIPWRLNFDYGSFRVN